MEVCTVSASLDRLSNLCPQVWICTLFSSWRRQRGPCGLGTCVRRMTRKGEICGLFSMGTLTACHHLPRKGKAALRLLLPNRLPKKEPMGEVIMEGQMPLHEKHSVRCGLAPSASVQDKFTPPLQAEMHTNLPEEVVKAAPWCRNTSVAQM